jgi:hypothetical protein
MKKSFIAAILATLAGCASMGMGENESNEQLLAAAGFHLYLPRNAEEERNLKAMPQRRVIYMDKAVKPTYLYADHDECDCIYVGGQAEVDQFQKLLKQKQIADERVQQAEYNQGLYGMGGMYGGMYGMGGMYPMGGLYGMGGMGVMGGYW